MPTSAGGAVRAVGPSLTPAQVDAANAAKIRMFMGASAVSIAVPDVPHRIFPCPFHMTGDQPKELSALRNVIAKHLKTPAEQLALTHVVLGRGTPKELNMIANAMAKEHPGRFSPFQTDGEAQRFLESQNIGTDCAGWVQMALCAMTGKTNAQLGLKDLYNEDLHALGSNSCFKEVQVHEARPGDVVLLKPLGPGGGAGHCAIVTEKEVTAMSASDAKVLFDLGLAFRAGDQVMALTVASSWNHEGVTEKTWLYDRDTNVWAYTDGGQLRNHLVVRGAPSGPYNETLVGVYRAK